MERLADIYKLGCLKYSDYALNPAAFDCIYGRILRCFYDEDFGLQQEMQRYLSLRKMFKNDDAPEIQKTILIWIEEELVNFFKDDNKIIKEGALHILAEAGGTVREQLAVLSSPVELTLERLCLEGSRKQAKYDVSRHKKTYTVLIQGRWRQY